MTRINQAIVGAATPVEAGKQRPQGDGSFSALLALGEASGIRFSRHALERISDRGIGFDRASMEKLGAALSVAEGKGANESLVLMDELALVVSVRNRTVITAMTSGDTKGNVFTSIDSAVIA